MEAQTIIPIHVIQTSLLNAHKEDMEIIDNRVIVKNETIGVKIGFGSNQSRFNVKYKNSILEFQNVSEVVVGIVDRDGWMKTFDAESELVVDGATPVAAACHYYPDVYFQS